LAVVLLNAVATERLREARLIVGRITLVCARVHGHAA